MNLKFKNTMSSSITSNIVTTRIKVNFNGILQIDYFGIRAYDLNYIPSKFNLIFKDDYFEITPGSEYKTYEWSTDYILEELIAVGKSILHIDMPLYEHFTLFQQDSTVYLHQNELDSLDVQLKNAILMTKLKVKHLIMKCEDSIVKGLFITFVLTINLTNNSTCYLDIEHCKVITRIKVDNSSLLYINNDLCKAKL